MCNFIVKISEDPDERTQLFFVCVCAAVFRIVCNVAFYFTNNKTYINLSFPCSRGEPRTSLFNEEKHKGELKIQIWTKLYILFYNESLGIQGKRFEHTEYFFFLDFS